jgi:hypothetical protein
VEVVRIEIGQLGEQLYMNVTYNQIFEISIAGRAFRDQNCLSISSPTSIYCSQKVTRAQGSIGGKQEMSTFSSQNQVIVSKFK